MTQPGPAQGAVENAVAAASVTAPPAAGKPARTWVSAVADRVSVKWLTGAGAALILAVSAAFGGLATVAEPPLPELVADDTFVGAALEMTPERVTLVDEAGGSGVFPIEGEERLLILALTTTNLDDDARSSGADGSLSEIRVEGAPDVDPTVSRADDGTLSPWLQPGVAADVLLTWAVPADAFADGDDIRVALHTATEFEGRDFIYGTYWDDIHTGAVATLTVEDAGAGATG